MDRSTAATAPLSTPLPGARPGRDPARAIKRGPSRLPPEVVAATQRDRLYDAIVQTVAQKGYANARVSDICHAAGVTRPAFYALFTGKDEAFVATYRHGTSVLLSLMQDAYEQEQDWRARSRAALRVLLDVLSAVPEFAKTALVEIDSVGGAAQLEREKLLQRFNDFFAEAPGADELLMPQEIIGSIVGGIYATIRRHVAEGRTSSLPDLLPVLSYFQMVAFVGRREAAKEFDTGRPDERTVPACAALDPILTPR